MKNISLIGMMGAGKTTVGRYLSEVLSSYKFIDVDSYIEEQEGITIPEIFERYTEVGFRRIEEETISEISKENNLIISIGGGAFESEENRNNLLNTSKVFYLCAPAQILYDRIKQETNRPMLYCSNPKERLKELLEKREINYKKADFIINTTDLAIEEIADNILRSFNDSNINS